RYLPQVLARGGQIVLACQKVLLRLLSQRSEITQFVTEGDPIPQFDVHCPLLNLPGIFNTDLNNIPRDVPYLRAQADSSFILPPSSFRVGLVWAGRPTHKRDRARSVPLEMLAGLSQIKNVQFISLQKGDAAAQTGHFP